VTEIPYKAIKSDDESRMKKKKKSVLRKKYSTRDIELRTRSKKKCCTEII
jgi:hypothetical protein